MEHFDRTIYDFNVCIEDSVRRTYRPRLCGCDTTRRWPRGLAFPPRRVPGPWRPQPDCEWSRQRPDACLISIRLLRFRVESILDLGRCASARVFNIKRASLARLSHSGVTVRHDRLCQPSRRRATIRIGVPERQHPVPHFVDGGRPATSSAKGSMCSSYSRRSAANQIGQLLLTKQVDIALLQPPILSG